MGLFSKKKNEEVAIDELTPQIKTKLDELAQKGNQFEEEEQYEEAIQAWKEALSLIPEPQQFYSETIWFLAAIGDIYFQKKQYEKAHECFDKARGNLSGEGYGNPFVMLRLGECCLEIYYRVPAVHGGVRWQEQRREGTQRVLRGVVPRVL